MLAKEIRLYIQEPILAACGWTDEASKLIIYGTGYIETGYAAIVQHDTPKNGGLGFYQAQPSDYLDMLRWFKNGFSKPLLDQILRACNFSALPLDPSHLIYNIAFATLVCRVHYGRNKEPLPPIGSEDTARLYAEYHYKYYNGDGEGKTDVDRNTQLFTRILNHEI